MKGSIQIYSVGLVHCSVCVPASMSPDEIEVFVNTEMPTGIGSPWKVSKDAAFADGTPNPCDCKDEPGVKKHYLMTC